MALRGGIRRRMARIIGASLMRPEVKASMKILYRGMFERLHKILSPDGTRKMLRSLICRDGGYWPQLISTFSEQHVLVLAPHMDDETLGCGGTLRKHVLSGAQVTAVYMTDGRRGGAAELSQRGLSRATIARYEAALIVQRREEAMRAAEIIGIHKQIMLDYPDGELTASREIVQQLRDILQQESPTVIYLPSILDLHHDHRATNRILYVLKSDR
jgi:hypothetical protein